MILLKLIAWPYARKHLLRTALTMVGVALGVAVFVAMRTANESIILAFSHTVDRIAGKTELQVSLGEAGFSEDVLEKVQSAKTVRVAVPIIETLADSNIAGQGSLLILGVDMTGDRSLRDYDLEGGDDSAIDDPLIFLAQADSLILSKEFANKNHLGKGSKLLLGTTDGLKRFTVRGIVKSPDLASAFGGNLAIMDIYAAQKMFGRGRTFDRIDLAVKPGVAVRDCEQELRTLLGPQFDVQPPSGRGQQFESLISGYSMMVRLSSAFALFIGMFIIYNAFAIAVTQRRSEIGILRALGGTRVQITSMFLGESALIGAIGAIAGLLVGMLVARAITSSISGLLNDVYGVAQPVEEITTSYSSMAIAVVLGIATSITAAIIPARAAAGIDPVQALQKGRFQLASPRENRIRALVALGLFALSVVCLPFQSFRPIFYTAYALTIAAAVLLVPILSRMVGRTLRPLFQWVRPVEGALATDSLLDSPRRTSATVTALMLSLALVIAFSGMASASVRSVVDWMNTSLTPDLFVLPSQSLDIKGARFPSAMGSELAAVPGIARVQWERDVRVTFRQTPIMVIALELNSLAQTDPRPVIAGDQSEMYRKSAAGEGLIVADNLAQREHLALGNTLDIAAPFGVIHLPIVGIVVDYSDQNGTILIDRTVFSQFWHDDSANAFRVFVNHGTDLATTRENIVQRYTGLRRVFVLTNTALKDYILKTVNQWFAMTSLQIVVAVLIAVLGVINTLTVSITDRRRELGILRAVGALHNQVRRTIWLEAIGVCAIGLVLGGAFGAINLFFVLEVARHDVVGMRLGYHFPTSTMLTLIPIMLGTGFAAALWPAEMAVRGSLVEALEYE